MEVNQNDDLYNNSYNELDKALSKLDLHLGTLKSSIECKRAECEKLEKSLNSDKEILLKFEKEVTKATSMATNMMRNIESFSTARLMAQSLEDSLLLQLQTTKDRCKNICSSQSQILSKYRDYLNNCEVIYTSLPWVEKRNKLKVELQCQQIKLSCLQKKFRDHQQKIRLFNEISEKRFQQAIISLAEACKLRNTELQKREDLCTREKRLTEDIKKLELEKKELLENVNKKAEVAVTQIRQRAQTYQSKSSIMPYFKKVTSSSQKAPTPISQRLGLVEGLSLSSPMDVKKLSQPARSPSQSKTRSSLSFDPFKISFPSKSPLQLPKASPRKPGRRSTPSPKPEVEVFALNSGKTTPLKELRIQGNKESKKVAKRKVRFTGEEENQPSKKVHHEGEAAIRKGVKEKDAQRDVKEAFRKPMPVQDVVQKKARESPSRRFNTGEKVKSPEVKLVSSPYSSPRGQTDKAAAQLAQGAEERNRRRKGFFLKPFLSTLPNRNNK